jgi:hypothetical protein
MFCLKVLDLPLVLPFVHYDTPLSGLFYKKKLLIWLCFYCLQGELSVLSYLPADDDCHSNHNDTISWFILPLT